eukprot:m.13505 g.13505  ORF g.13505 m.13505 type:complete len:243 (+) comp4163_c0_seq2:52-780(+)
MELVRQWLESVRLGEYADMFLKQGYDDPIVIGELHDKDLCELGIKLPGHRKRILIHGKRFDADKFQASLDAAAKATATRPLSIFRKPGDSLPSLPGVTQSASSSDNDGEISIQNEGTSVIRKMPISSFTTASEVVSNFVDDVKPVKADANSVWALYEVFEMPPVERRLEDGERVLAAKTKWPKTEGCRFLFREIARETLGVSDATKMVCGDENKEQSGAQVNIIIYLPQPYLGQVGQTWWTS